MQAFRYNVTHTEYSPIYTQNNTIYTTIQNIEYNVEMQNKK